MATQTSSPLRFQVDARLEGDLELLLNGAFAPLTGFMTQKEYQSVLDNMRLLDGTVFPLPIVLPVPSSVCPSVAVGQSLQLLDTFGMHCCTMLVEDVYSPDLLVECAKSLGTTESNHPFVPVILARTGCVYVGGTITHKKQLPFHADFQALRKTPGELRQYFSDHGWTTIVGFQTRNVCHRSHYELTRIALREAGPDAKLLLHPTVGMTQACDTEYHTRVRCYQKLMTRYDTGTACLSLLNLSMRMGGPRECLLHAIVRKNYGCTHFIVGRDHAGPSSRLSTGGTFYGPYDAQTLVLQFRHEIGIRVIVSPNVCYVPELSRFCQEPTIPAGCSVANISGTQQRQMLEQGADVPEWFSFPDVIAEARQDFTKRGICIYLVGLSGSGKTTIARALEQRLLETHTGNSVTMLDADEIRTHLSKGLGFSREDRSANIRRIGYVAKTIVKHAGVCLVANIAPYEEDRAFNRAAISKVGRYIEVFVDTPLGVCEHRDVKGLYAKARSGQIQNMTGIQDAFERPQHADLVIDTSVSSLSECVDTILAKADQVV